MPLVEDFVKHMISMSGILLADSVSGLLQALQISLKKIFKAIRINFFLQCEETIKTLKKEGC